MKIHVACGKHVLHGYVNVDMVRHPAATREPEYLGYNVNDLSFCKDGEATELLAVHILEHFYEWEVPQVLGEWYRVLGPGGKLIIEMPDVVKAAKMLVDGVKDNKWHMWPLYGDNTLKDPLMCHKWGWTYNTIYHYLADAGFTKIVEAPPEWHGRKVNRDFRVEASKK